MLLGTVTALPTLSMLLALSVLLDPLCAHQAESVFRNEGQVVVPPCA